MLMKNFLLISFAFFFFLTTKQELTAQTDTLEVPIDNQLENVIEETIGEGEDNQLNEVIENLIQNQVEINEATIDDLTKIPFLDLSIATEIIKYRNKTVLYTL
jgi:DNA uptake protein ComE-like DNA-binding protein